MDSGHDKAGRQSFELAERARETIARWTSRLRDDLTTRPTAKRPSTIRDAAYDATVGLSVQVAALGVEIDQVQAQLDDLRRQSLAIEDRAMQAIQAGDDRAAKAALEELMTRTDLDAAPLEADLVVLRALASECHRVLEDHPVEAFVRDGA